MIENLDGSFSFSIENDMNLKELVYDINSSFSAEIECSFDISIELEEEIYSIDDLIKNRKKRKGIPEDVS